MKGENFVALTFRLGFRLGYKYLLRDYNIIVSFN